MALNSLDFPTSDATVKLGHDIDDFVWMEILYRLPSTKSIFRCKCVSKHWDSLISNQYFIRRFIDHHREKYRSDFNSDQLLLFFNYAIDTKDEQPTVQWPEADSWVVGFLASGGGDPEGTKQGLILPLPTYQVECSFNDLLVLSEKRSLVCPDTESYHIAYHIVNPFTKEHIELPMSNLDVPFYHSQNCDVGFVCEPFYAPSGRKFSLNGDFRYRVVQIVSWASVDGECSTLETYHSETREWSVRIGLKRTTYGCSSNNVVAHNGKLYWYNLSGNVVVYDPFAATGEPCFHFLGFKVPSPSSPGHYLLAKSQGSLLSINVQRRNIFIWKLKEKGGGSDDHKEWCFERSVAENDIFSDTIPMVMYQNLAEGGYLPVLGIHPSDADVIFIGYFDSPRVASFNLNTKEWKEVGEIKEVSDFICMLARNFGVPATLMWWPTPVH